MLDYILSKMVLLIFLLLLVAAFTLIQHSLDSYFAQQAAKTFSSQLAGDVTRIVTTVRSTSEVRAYPLPPFLRAGQTEIPYDLNIIAFKKGSTCYLGILVMDHVRKKPLSAEVVALGDDSKVELHVCGNAGDVFATSAVTKEQYFILERTLDLSTGNMVLTVCASEDPTGCSCSTGDLC